MTKDVIAIDKDFWNIRGAFRFAGVVNVGTQCSLVRLASGRFVLLDCYTLKGAVADEVMTLTEGGELLEAIFNLHPFHTVHVKAVAAMFPKAKLYGTARHKQRFADLKWEAETTESAEFARLYAEDFDFSVPAGVHLIPANEHMHFSSVLAIHKASQTLHVDDTLMWTPFPFQRISFHPSLRFVLEDRPDAAADFRAWAQAFVTRCEDVRHICTAHAKLAPIHDEAGGIARRVAKALGRVEGVLRRHERRQQASSLTA